MKQREYNIRLIEVKNGAFLLDWVQGLYATKKKNVKEWKDVPHSVRAKISNRFHIKMVQ